MFEWGGAYIGAHTGYGGGNSRPTLANAPIAFPNHSYGSVTGGIQAGYNIVLPSRLLLGVEADATFMNYLDSNALVSSPAAAA